MAGLNLAKFLWQRTIALLRASAAVLVAEETIDTPRFLLKAKKKENRSAWPDPPISGFDKPSRFCCTAGPALHTPSQGGRVGLKDV